MVIQGLRPSSISNKYQKDPILFAEEILGIPRHTLKWSEASQYNDHQWDGTPDPISTALESLAEGKNVGVEGATGTGKTVLESVAALWFLASFQNSIVVTVAPKYPQLKLHLWKEIGKLWPNFSKQYPLAELIDLKIRMGRAREDWIAVGFPVGVGASELSATKAQGFHAENMLIVYDETPGVDPAVMMAFDNTCVSQNNLQIGIGNPDFQFDPLHQFCVRHDVKHIRVSGYDHPNVVKKDPLDIPGAITKEKIDSRRKRFGTSSPLYLSRCRGICPQDSENALIKIEWCKESIGRSFEDQDRMICLGIDVANSVDGDMAAVARGYGRTLLTIDEFQCPDANEMGRKYAKKAERDGVIGDYIGIDSVGVGVGCLNEFIAAGIYALGLNGGAKPEYDGEETQYVNLRSQMWWTLREDLRLGQIALIDDDELFADLTIPEWGTKNGKIFIEPKEKIKKRLGRSPNKGDAVVYWNWVRHRGLSFAAGSSYSIVDESVKKTREWTPRESIGGKFNV